MRQTKTLSLTTEIKIPCTSSTLDNASSWIAHSSIFQYTYNNKQYFLLFKAFPSFQNIKVREIEAKSYDQVLKVPTFLAQDSGLNCFQRFQSIWRDKPKNHKKNNVINCSLSWPYSKVIVSSSLQWQYGAALVTTESK